MPNVWNIGEKRRLKATFTPEEASGDPTAPVTITIFLPDGSKGVDSQNMSAETAKIYFYDYVATKTGLHTFRVKSADLAIAKGFFEVEPD